MDKGDRLPISHLLDEEEECDLWLVAATRLNETELQELVAGLVKPPFLASDDCSANWLPLNVIPVALLPLLQPYTLVRERSRHWLWDGAGPGIFLPGALIQRLTERVYEALYERNALPGFYTELMAQQ
jgi:hypothetical protein